MLRADAALLGLGASKAASLAVRNARPATGSFRRARVSVADGLYAPEAEGLPVLPAVLIAHCTQESFIKPSGCEEGRNFPYRARAEATGRSVPSLTRQRLEVQAAQSSSWEVPPPFSLIAILPSFAEAIEFGFALELAIPGPFAFAFRLGLIGKRLLGLVLPFAFGEVPTAKTLRVRPGGDVAGGVRGPFAFPGLSAPPGALHVLLWAEVAWVVQVLPFYKLGLDTLMALAFLAPFPGGIDGFRLGIQVGDSEAPQETP